MQAFRQYLASDRAAELEEKRAVFLAQIDAAIARCLYLYERCKDTKPLAAENHGIFIPQAHHPAPHQLVSGFPASSKRRQRCWPRRRAAT